MKALCWCGTRDVRVERVPDPKILDGRDAILKVTATAICGSDLHLYNGFMPTMQPGDILGHEFMGEVVDIGREIHNLQIGDRIVVPFCMACGNCFFCKQGLTSLCDNTNPNAEAARKIMGYSPAGLFGYSHLLGGFAGGQAEYVRVPFADVGHIKVPGQLADEQVLFLSDIFPTGYMAAENCGIQPGDTVAVWGCGPVAQFAIQSAWMLGAHRVIAIDRLPERLLMAQEHGKAEVINFERESVYETLLAMTGGRGPDRCIDAVGTETHTRGSVDAVVDRAKQVSFLGTDRAHTLREAIYCCRKGGTVSVPGVYIGLLDHIPFGAAMNKGLTFKMGQTHVHRYLQLLMEKIESGQIDPSFVITHRLRLDDAPSGYRRFSNKDDNCIKIVMKP
jgi:threonine dehydrogenase-like Zn-dependent dehydrogenase